VGPQLNYCHIIRHYWASLLTCELGHALEVDVVDYGGLRTTFGINGEYHHAVGGRLVQVVYHKGHWRVLY